VLTVWKPALQISTENGYLRRSFNVHGVSQRSPFESDTVAPLGEESTVHASDRPRVIVAQPLPIPASKTRPAAAAGRKNDFIEFFPC
jgi:hypothetical protein